MPWDVCPKMVLLNSNQVPGSWTLEAGFLLLSAVIIIVVLMPPPSPPPPPVKSNCQSTCLHPTLRKWDPVVLATEQEGKHQCVWLDVKGVSQPLLSVFLDVI